MVSTTDTLPIISRDLINTLELGVQGSPMVHGVQRNTQPESCTTPTQWAEVCIDGPSPPTEAVGTKDGVTLCDVVSVGVAQSAGYTPLLQEFPALSLDTLGVFPDFQHRIKLKPDTVPVACHPRLIPLALCEGVEKAKTRKQNETDIGTG